MNGTRDLHQYLEHSWVGILRFVQNHTKLAPAELLQHLWPLQEADGEPNLVIEREQAVAAMRKLWLPMRIVPPDGTCNRSSKVCSATAPQTSFSHAMAAWIGRPGARTTAPLPMSDSSSAVICRKTPVFGPPL